MRAFLALANTELSDDRLLETPSLELDLYCGQYKSVLINSKGFISLLDHSFVVVLLIMLSLRTIFTSLVSCSERYNEIIYGMLIKKMKELQNACSFRVRETSRNRDDFIVLDTFANFTYHTQCQCSMYSCF